MTFEQEEALYEFLSFRTEPFSIKEARAAIKTRDGHRISWISSEIANVINSHRLAFEISPNKWITRRGCFANASFIISPSRIEIANGILIPGHRCVPFANPVVLPGEYTFLWNGKELPSTTTEADPSDIYPYYSIYGEEFAPQFIARENPENEEAFNADPYEDPPEVSIKTIDMRHFFRESSFVPGDMLRVTINDWQKCVFNLERIAKDSWSKTELNEWVLCAEAGFKKAFENVNIECTTEEQVAWAYFYGGERMRSVPAFSLEDFLYQQTDKIEIAQFGIESRFWYAGKEIPDYTKLVGVQTQSDQTPLEQMLFQNNVPISEFVVQSYVRDALFRNDIDVIDVIQRIIPPSIVVKRWHIEMLAEYIVETFEEFKKTYSVFTDQKSGPVRQRFGELHTAVIELTARLEHGEIDHTWLPKHSFIVLSQIQHHASGILEDLDVDGEPLETDISAIDNSLESMIDTYTEIKQLIEKSLDNYRRSNITLTTHESSSELPWRIIQISIGGTDVWRRLLIPQEITLIELHYIIQAIFDWNGIYPYCFTFESRSDAEFLDDDNKIKTFLPVSALIGRGFSEIVYEYGNIWNVKIIVLSVYNAKAAEEPHCIAGENAPPPETVGGPLRFRRFISALDTHNLEERDNAKENLGENFKVDAFNIGDCNKKIKTTIEKFKG
jgi:hypothetical protein